jgi:hypothetical protein
MRTHLDLIALAGVVAVTAACSSGGTEATASTGSGGGATTSTTGGNTGTASTGTGSGSSTVIAMGLYSPTHLALFDSTVYWSTQGGTITKLAVTGGTPQVILPSANASVLAVDASGVYWITGSPPAIMHAGLDGGSPGMVAPIDGVNGGELLLFGGNLYLSGKIGPDAGIISVPAAGGAPKMLHSDLAAQGLRLADASGLTWEEPTTSPPASTLMHAGLDGSGAVAIVTLNIGTQQYLRGVSSDATSVWYGVRDQSGSSDTSFLYKVAVGGGAAEKVFTFAGELDDSAGDAKGLYFGDDKFETSGVYVANADGKTSVLIDGEHSPGNIRFMHMDAKHLVWMDGDDSGQTRLHAYAR